MTNLKGPRGLLLLALMLPCMAGAYEAEDAVPLTLNALLGKLRLERLSVKLNGREVEISATLRNNESTPQTLGLYAATPVFAQLGEGEEHADKTFSELAVSFAGGPFQRAAVTRRGYFMGQDVTAALARAGIGALPDANVSEKQLARVRFPFGMRASDWEGAVTHAWTGRLAPNTSAAATVRYRALPQFGIDDISSPYFRQQVQQHCGDPDKAIAEIVKHNGGSQYVMTERFELPVGFMKMQEVVLDVAQPATNWLGAHPILSLVCGLPGEGKQPALAGTLASANQRISVLVVSRMATAGEGKGGADVK